MARAMGFTVFGTAGTAKGLELVKREGAHQVFEHGKAGDHEEIMKATSGRGVDIILEMLANVNLGTDLKLLAMNGRVIIIGNRGEITINPRGLMARRASARGFTLWAITPEEEADIHAGLIAGLKTAPYGLSWARNCLWQKRHARTKKFWSLARRERSSSCHDRPRTQLFASRGVRQRAKFCFIIGIRQQRREKTCNHRTRYRVRCPHTHDPSRAPECDQPLPSQAYRQDLHRH